MSKLKFCITKYLAICIAALLLMSPVFVRASETDNLVEETLVEEDAGTEEIIEDTAGDADAADPERQQLIDEIDTDLLMEEIDEDELRAQIDEDELNAELDRLQEEEEDIENLDVLSVTVPLPTAADDAPAEGVARIELPVLENNKMFNFIMDPQSLIYSTGAAAYGGGKVEEGASILFWNTEGDYIFSSESDKLTIKNKGTAPVKVVITARMENLGELELSDDYTFAGNDKPAIYMALVDSNGKEVPVLPGEEVEIDAVLEAAPKEKVVYYLNEETGNYETSRPGDDEVESQSESYSAYSFGLIGACNVNAQWAGLSSSPKINVSWRTEPINPEEEAALKAALAEDDQDEGAPGNTAGPRPTLREAKLEQLREAKLEELKAEKLEELIEEKLEELSQQEDDADKNSG